MTDPALQIDDSLSQAASLAFALIRFEEVAAHWLKSFTSPLQPVIGRDAYIFTPSWRPVPRDSVVTFLAALSSPALLSPTTTRGMVAMTLLDELSGERHKWAKKTLDNYRAGLESSAAQLGLTDQSRILLEFDEEEHVFSLAVMRLFTECFAVQVGWAIQPLEHDRRASARLMLFRSDGERAWGQWCPVRWPTDPPPHSH